MFYSRVSWIGPKIPRRGAPGVGTVGAWVGKKAESPRTRRACAACHVKCSPKGPKLGFEYLPTYKILSPSAGHLEERLSVSQSVS